MLRAPRLGQRVRHYGSAAGVANVGDTIHGFQLKNVKSIPEINVVAHVLEHEKTGAEHLHLQSSDKNNVFSVAFRTPPTDSTGVFHILEHTVLCSSKKYPGKDAFFSMSNRSVNTYMNAWTASTFTMYPFSTQNGKDYQNLMSVYLDAVFFPNLLEHDFDREGHRLEFDDPADPSVLRNHGVVYNEMKGALSDTSSLFLTRLQQALYPGTPYEHVSGGDPPNILDLTWEDLKEAHLNHYHPSNAKFFSYGDMSLASTLEMVNENALRHFNRQTAAPEIPLVSRLAGPTRQTFSGPYDALQGDAEKQTKMTVAFLASDVTDPVESFCLKMLSSLLMGGPPSPLYKALIDTNIGSDFAPGTGYSGDAREAAFCVGLQGISASQVEDVEDIIMATLRKSAEEGFPAERINSALHQMELSLKHVRSNFGLTCASIIAEPWNHGGNPVEALCFNDQIEQFNKRLEANPRFLQEKITEVFLNNPHRLTMVMNADEGYTEQNDASERALLDKKSAALTAEDRECINAKASKVAEEQNKEPDTSCLPTVLVEDVARECERVHVDVGMVAGREVQLVPQPTNGISYLRLWVDTSDLPADLKPYVPLFCSTVGSVGAGSLDYSALSHALEARTGGISAAPSVCTHPSELGLHAEGIVIKSHALDRNLDHMFSLLGEALAAPHIDDTKRLETLVGMIASDLSQSVPGSGHAFASQHCKSAFSAAEALQEVYGGLTQVRFMQQVSKTSTSETVEKLRAIYEHVRGARTTTRASFVSDPASAGDAEGHLARLFGQIGGGSNDRPHGPAFLSSPFEVPNTLANPVDFFAFPMPVNYAAAVLPIPPGLHEDSAPLTVLSRLVSSLYLLTEIRLKGGAYGAGAGTGDGLWKFYSYRDPNTEETLRTFENTLKWVQTDPAVTKEAVEEAKLSVFGGLDAPTVPASRGTSYFLRGITNEMQQTSRDRYFDVNLDDVQRVAAQYLATNRPRTSAIVGSDAASEIAKSNGWTWHNE